MTKSKIFVFIMIAGLALSCSKRSDADKIQEAQSCLDSATQATWAECMTFVEGMESAASYNIRCVGKFIEQGFGSSTKLEQMMTAISGSSGTSESTGVMSALAFDASTDMALNNSNAEITLRYCSASESPGLIFLSSISQIATSIAFIQGLTASQMNDPAQLLTAIGALQGNPAAQTAVGTAAIAAYNSNCTGQNASQNGDFCTQFGSAVSAAGGTSNPEDVGAIVLLCYATPTDPRCTGF
jgi:hypothetical protein